MKPEELFKILAIILIGCFIIYVVMNLFNGRRKEGLTNNNANAVSGEAGTSASYASGIKAQMIKLQDELLISKYRKDYESVIINMDDYVGFLMLKQILNMKTGTDVQTNIDGFNNLNTLKMAKDALNSTMVFLDKQ